MPQKLFSNLGESTELNHISIQTGERMLRFAQVLFEMLGYTEYILRHSRGDWGEARFFDKPGHLTIQLTESTDKTPMRTGENHLGFRVDHPQELALEVATWIRKWDIPASLENSGDNWFVDAPKLLSHALEFSPKG